MNKNIQTTENEEFSKHHVYSHRGARGIGLQPLHLWSSKPQASAGELWGPSHQTDPHPTGERRPAWERVQDLGATCQLCEVSDGVVEQLCLSRRKNSSFGTSITTALISIEVARSVAFVSVSVEAFIAEQECISAIRAVRHVSVLLDAPSHIDFGVAMRTNLNDHIFFCLAIRCHIVFLPFLA